jgi:hypothetical protein
MGQCAYVIDAGIGLVKIGLSGAPLQRVLDLQTGSPVKLSLGHVEPIANVAPQAVEQTAHRLLEGAWSHGEWFFATVAQGIEALWWAITIELNAKACGIYRPTIGVAVPRRRPGRPRSGEADGTITAADETFWRVLAVFADARARAAACDRRRPRGSGAATIAQAPAAAVCAQAAAA